jgi:hypothetical protein
MLRAGADLLFLPYLRLRAPRSKKAVDAIPKPLFNVVIDPPREELERAGLRSRSIRCNCSSPTNGQGVEGDGHNGQSRKAYPFLRRIQ